MKFFDIGISYPMIHSILGHFPVALSVIGVPLVIFCAFGVTYVNGYRVLASLNYLLVAVVAFFAMENGEEIRGALSGAMPAEIWGEVEHHESMGHKVWFFGLATSLIMAMSTLKYEWLRRAAAWVGVAASIATVVWVGMTARDGARLVYERGLAVHAVELLEPPPPYPRPGDAEPAFNLELREESSETSVPEVAVPDAAAGPEKIEAEESQPLAPRAVDEPATEETGEADQPNDLIAEPNDPQSLEHESTGEISSETDGTDAGVGDSDPQ